MTRPIIASAADAAFFPLLMDLLDSLTAAGIGAEIDRGVVDLGLTDEQRNMLRAQGVILSKPYIAIVLPRGLLPTKSEQATLVRSSYPTLFPDSDPILHMDADTWVQSRDAVDAYIAGARAGHFAITPQHDPCYHHTSGAIRWRWVRLRDYFGQLTAWRLISRTYYNAGVFALSRNSPLWGAFTNVFQQALAVSRRHLVSDQTVLNYIIHTQEIGLLELPPTHNWAIHLATPMLDPVRGLLLRPAPPHEPLGIVHLTAHNKLAPRLLRLLGGGHAEIALCRTAVHACIRNLRDVDRVRISSDA